jgi:hypothetical protein
VTERAEVSQVVDEHSIALVGRHSTRRGVWRRDEVFLFQRRHVIADRRRGHTKSVSLNDPLRTHRLPRSNVVLHDDAQHFQAAIRHHPFSASRTHALLALDLPEC